MLLLSKVVDIAGNEIILGKRIQTQILVNVNRIKIQIKIRMNQRFVYGVEFFALLH